MSNLIQLAQYKAAKLEESNTKRKLLAAQFPLLFSPQKSQKFEEDRIAPTTKYALSQMSKVSNRVVDNENFNWVQSNITTSPAVKDHKTPQSKKLTNSSKRNKSKLVLAEPKQKVTSTPTSAANSKSVLKTLKSPSAVSQKKRSDQVVNVLPATNKAKPETPQLQTAGPVQNSVEFLDIYTHCDVQESMIVNFEVEDRLWTPIPRISKARIVESSEAHDAVSQGAIELSDIYEDKMSEVEEQAGITVTISCNAVHTPVLDLALSPENPESTRFEDIYGAAEGENDSMFVNIVANDVAKTPYIPSLKSLLNGERGNVETSLLEMLSPAGTDSMISLEADEIADNRIIDEIDEVHNQTVIRRSLVLSSLKAFISSMDVNIEPQVTCDIQASELQEVSTPDLLEGKIHSRESLEDYWQSACRDPGSLATPAKDAEPAEVPQEVVCAISEMTSAETQQQAMKPHLDQYSLNSTAQFRIESVAYEIRYDHVKYVVQGQFSMTLDSDVCIDFVTHRRYSEFVELYSRLYGSLDANGCLDRVALVDLPAKQALPFIGARWKHNGLLRYRATELYSWLQAACRLVSSLDYSGCEHEQKAARGIRASLWRFLFG